MFPQHLSNQEETRTKPVNMVLLGLLSLTMVAIALYITMRLIYFIQADYIWQDKLVAAALLLAELFMLMHSVGYFRNLIKVTQHSKQAAAVDDLACELDTYPPVAIVVSSFREPIEIVEQTLTCFYNLSYPNKHIYFLDDTRYSLPGADPEQDQAYRTQVDNMCQRLGIDLFRRSWRGAKAGMINDFLSFIGADMKEGFEYSSFSGQPRGEKEKYIAVFDADQNPFPDFVEPLVALMERNPELAFVQTPQYYTNFETNRVARASGLQQVVFFEYICEGKGTQDAMFCCGTNVMFRTEALEDVGGLDESSVTEDFATSLAFHLQGWHSSYINKVCAFGMGPEDLGGFFKQQFRWALGCVGQARRLLFQFMRQRKKLPLAVWWEYLMSSTYYFVGWSFFIMVLCPVLYLFVGIPTYFSYPEFYFLFFTPYLILALSIFFWTLYRRNYRPGDIYSGMVLISVTFPVYMKAALLGLFGVKGTFGVTPKTGQHSLPLWALWPQIMLALVCLAAVVWGGHRMFYERQQFGALALNSGWCLYFFATLTGVFYFNRPVVEK